LFAAILESQIPAGVTGGEFELHDACSGSRRIFRIDFRRLGRNRHRAREKHRDRNCREAAAGALQSGL